MLFKPQTEVESQRSSLLYTILRSYMSRRIADSSASCLCGCGKLLRHDPRFASITRWPVSRVAVCTDEVIPLASTLEWPDSRAGQRGGQVTGDW